MPPPNGSLVKGNLTPILQKGDQAAAMNCSPGARSAFVKTSSAGNCWAVQFRGPARGLEASAPWYISSVREGVARGKGVNRLVDQAPARVANLKIVARGERVPAEHKVCTGTPNRFWRSPAPSFPCCNRW